MIEIGYHASHEQFAPSELLHFVERAEAAGFACAMCSDHFHPWSDAQGHSGHAWSWLGAAMGRCSFSFGVVNAPGQRYHPAVIGQAAATLTEMYPGRFWVALGSGQYLNEVITGDRWPSKQERQDRLLECVEVIRRLWKGENVALHHGRIHVEGARLHTLPIEPPMLIGAALTPETARWVGGWADGLITVSGPKEQMIETIEAFREGGGEGKPMYLKVQVSYAATDDQAERGAFEQWRTAVLDSSVLAELRSPAQFEAASAYVSGDQMHELVRISSDLSRHVDWLEEDIALGFDRLYLHNVNREQDLFIDAFGSRVIPRLCAQE